MEGDTLLLFLVQCSPFAQRSLDRIEDGIVAEKAPATVELVSCE